MESRVQERTAQLTEANVALQAEFTLELPVSVELRQNKYLNNQAEQDHRL